MGDFPTELDFHVELDVRLEPSKPAPYPLTWDWRIDTDGSRWAHNPDKTLELHVTANQVLGLWRWTVGIVRDDYEEVASGHAKTMRGAQRAAEKMAPKAWNLTRGLRA